MTENQIRIFHLQSLLKGRNTSINSITKSQSARTFGGTTANGIWQISCTAHYIIRSGAGNKTCSKSRNYDVHPTYYIASMRH